MRYLLDTHTFLWILLNTKELPERVMNIIRDEDNRFFLSSISGMELAIKYSIGKLKLDIAPEEMIREALDSGWVSDLPLQMEHATYLQHLPLFHNDPFDRILVAQSILENMPLITKDEMIGKYPVTVIW